MARGWHYTKLSLSSALLLFFLWQVYSVIAPFFLSFLFSFRYVFFCSRWSFVDVPLIFFPPADHVSDWQPRILLGMVKARSVNVKKTTSTVTHMSFIFLPPLECPLISLRFPHLSVK